FHRHPPSRHFTLSLHDALPIFRDGKPIVVDSADIVPGDIVELKMGDSIPADIRLIEAMNFETDEALLTGESLPIRKDPALTLPRSEEHTSELQSRENLVCRLLL